MTSLIKKLEGRLAIATKGTSLNEETITKGIALGIKDAIREIRNHQNDLKVQRAMRKAIENNTKKILKDQDDLRYITDVDGLADAVIKAWLEGA